jgi:Fe-S-cluster-containing hydrogenase component 2
MAAFVEKTLCRGCGVCTRVCPVGAITLDRGTATVNSEKCTECGACVQVCPLGTISLGEKTEVQNLPAQIQRIPQNRFVRWGGMSRGTGRGIQYSVESKQISSDAGSLEVLHRQAENMRRQLELIQQRIKQLEKSNPL